MCRAIIVRTERASCWSCPVYLTDSSQRVMQAPCLLKENASCACHASWRPPKILEPIGTTLDKVSFLVGFQIMVGRTSAGLTRVGRAFRASSRSGQTQRIPRAGRAYRNRPDSSGDWLDASFNGLSPPAGPEPPPEAGQEVLVTMLVRQTQGRSWTDLGLRSRHWILPLGSPRIKPSHSSVQLNFFLPRGQFSIPHSHYVVLGFRFCARKPCPDQCRLADLRSSERSTADAIRCRLSTSGRSCHNRSAKVHIAGEGNAPEMTSKT